jgi:hypothetical protein
MTIIAENDSFWQTPRAVRHDDEFGWVASTGWRCGYTGKTVGFVFDVGDKTVLWPLTSGSIDPYYIGGCV